MESLESRLKKLESKGLQLTSGKDRVNDYYSKPGVSVYSVTIAGMTDDQFENYYNKISPLETWEDIYDKFYTHQKNKEPLLVMDFRIWLKENYNIPTKK